jgi:hypothetical protein
MSQYHTINAGELERGSTVIARLDSSPITAGTVNFYLKCKSGANAGKWWKNSDQTWQAAETANAMTHDADGHWDILLTAGASGPFVAGVRYLEYVKESGNLHVPEGRLLVCDAAPGTLGGPPVVGMGGGSGPTAGMAAEDIHTTAFKNGTARLCARLYKDGADIHRADVSTIVYSVFLLDDQDPDARTAVSGHSAVSLAAADVIFDALQTDSQASDYNFRHVIPVAAHPAFTIAGRNYLVEYTISPTTGEKIILRFRVHVL